MKKLLISTAATISTLFAAGCGGYTPAEQAYLAEVTTGYDVASLSDPAGELALGHSVCDQIGNERSQSAREDLASFMSWNHAPLNHTNVASALYNLCPEFGIQR